MAEKSYNKIEDFSSEKDPTNGLQWSGKSVREFINESASIAKSNRASKFGAEYWVPGSFRKLNFASQEDLDTWLETGDDSLILSQTEPTPVGTVYQVKVNNKMGSDTLYFTTQAEKAEITVSFESQQKGVTDTVWEEFIEDYYVSVFIDKGGLGNFVPVISNQLVTSGSDFTFDIRKSLGTGTNRIRISAVGSESEAKGSKVINANLTSMYLAPSNFTWYKPFVEGDTYNLGGVNIGGNIQKTLKIRVSKEGYEKLYEVNIGSDIYTTTAYVFKGMEFPEAGTGVYNVDMWLDANGLESDHLVYNIICVSQADKFSAQLVAIGDPAKVVYNFTDNVLFQYCVYNGGTASGTPHIKLVSLVNTNPTTLIDEDLVNVATASPLTYTASLEIEMEDDSASLQLEAFLTYGNEQVIIYPVDNSKSYPATTGAVFYLNPSARSNAQDNRDKIINAVTSAQIDATFKRMSWAEGADGWTTDDEGRRCLRLPATTGVDVAYQPLASVAQKTIEFVYKVKNAADYDEPIISICSDVNDPLFRGIKITPKNILIHSRDLNVEDSLQDYNTTDEETLHVLITIIPNYKTNYGNLAQIYCNGTKVRSFSFESADRWDVAANVKMGSETADLFIYKMRVYDRGFESYDALKNYVNSLPSTAEKENAMLEIEAPLDDSYKLSYDDCVKNGLNTMVIEILDQDQTIPSMVNQSSKQCNLWINIYNPESGELDEDFAYLFGGNDILNQTIEGQGTTAMTYARWNFRWKLDSTYNKRRITAKKNFASSMHSHKMGATRLFNDLNAKIVGPNDADARTAVYQYPVYGFQKILIEGTVGQYRYEPIGLYTIGPDKGDKPTFGFNNKAFKNTLIHMEGTDHTPKGVGMDYPWDKLVYSGSGEGFGAVLQTGDVEVAWEVGAAGDYDPKDDPTDVKAMLDVEFKPAYEVAYKNSPYILGVTETLAEMNADVAAWQAMKTEDGVEYSGLEFFTDGVYDLYYFNTQSQKYEASGVNILSDLGMLASALSGMSLAEKTNIIKNARRQRFANTWGQYWNTNDAVFTYTAIMLTGATDNFKKNSYPYKFKAFADGGKWRWRHDDLDTIFDINNQGLAAKVYSILVGDSTGTGSVYRGDNSVFWTLVKETQQDAIKAMVHLIYNAMVELSPYSGSTLDKIYGCYKHYFWDKAQDYFAPSAYNKDAEWTYEDTWAAGLFSSDGINPLTQALGGHYEAERDWVKLRIIFTAAYYNYGPFNPSGYQDISTGQLGYGGANTHTFMFVPAIDFNPTVLRGQSGYFTVGDRVKAGETAPLTIPNISGADTRIYVQGVDWMEDVGDLSDLQVSADYTTLSVGSKRLKRFKLGDEDASKVKTNVKNLDFKECPSMIVVDARNVSTLGGNVDLTKMPRLQEAYFGGTGVKSISLPNGAKVTQFQIGEEVTQLSMMNLMFLEREGFDYTSLPKLEFLRIENCPAINPYQMLKELYNLDGSALRDIRVIGFDEQGTWEDFEMIANMANDIDKDGNHHIYNGIDSEGVPMDDSKPVIEGKLSTDGNIFEDTRDFIEGAFPNIEMEYNDLYLRIKDPEVYRVLHENSGKGDEVGMTVGEAESIGDIYTWFQGNTEIETFDELPRFKEIKDLKQDSFADCTSLKSIDLVNVESINARSFVGCTSLSSDVYCPNLTFTSYRIFQNSNIASFYAPRITILYDLAFDGCSNLKTVNIESVATLSGGVFSGCSSLEEIVMPNVETVSDQTFLNTTSLAQHVELPKLRRLAYQLFKDSGILSFSAPNVDIISSISESRQTFYQCPYLQSITVPKLSHIDGSFAGKCASLKSVICSSATHIGNSAFASCTALEDITLENVTVLESNAFIYCSSLKTVDLRSVEQLGHYVFQKCTELTGEIELPKLIGTIGSYAFQLTKITALNAPNATGLLDGACESCANLVSVELNSVETLGSYVFQNCTSLRSVTMPNVKRLGGASFKNCSSLTNFDFSNIEELSVSEFSGCAMLAIDVNLPKITRLPYAAFWSSGILSLTAQNVTETSADGNTCNSCKSLVSVDIRNAENLGPSLFYACSSLVSIRIDKAKTMSSSVFFNCSSLRDVTANNIEEIGDYVFYGCGALTSIDLSKAKKVGTAAFYACKSLTSIELGDVESIGASAFSTCTSLSHVIIRAVTPPALANVSAFSGTTHPIYVPDASVNAYKAASNWSSLSSRIKPLSEYVEPSNEE